MLKATLKTKSYLHLLVTLLGIIIVMPFVQIREGLVDNLIVTLFFLVLLIFSLKTLSTRGVKPRSNHLKWLLRIIAAVAFLTDIAVTIIYAYTEIGSSIFQLLDAQHPRIWGYHR